MGSKASSGDTIGSGATKRHSELRVNQRKAGFVAALQIWDERSLLLGLVGRTGCRAPGLLVSHWVR